MYISMVIPGYRKRTPLHVIAETDNHEALELLYNSITITTVFKEKTSFRLCATDEDNLTPIHLAARVGSARALDFMMCKCMELAYLHGNNIIHRDLSSNNILLRGGGIQAKVTDFGMSKMVEANPRMTRSKITQCPGTPAFMPPEAKPSYSDKLDIFSLGVLVVQIITRCFPTPQMP